MTTENKVNLQYFPSCVKSKYSSIPTILMLQNLHKLITCLIFIYCLLLGTQHLNAEVIFQQDDHCLAYQTEESILFFIDSIVIGKTCEISTQVEREDGNTRFLVNFPISSLDSGVGIRDEDVTEMLSVESNTEISFVSDFLTLEQFRSAITHGKTNLGGMLKIAGKTYKVIFPLKLSEHSGTWLVTGKLISSLSKFGLELPSVLGGLIANTSDYLEIHVHLRFKLMHGMPYF